MPDEDAFHLERFVVAQAPIFTAALGATSGGSVEACHEPGLNHPTGY